jgi:hypothetical protein
VQKKSACREEVIVAGFFWGCFALSFIGGIGGAVFIVGWQAVHWLKYAVWPPVQVIDASQYMQVVPPATGWAGVDTVMLSILQSPLSVMLVFASAVVGFIFVMIAEGIEKRENLRLRATSRNRR